MREQARAMHSAIIGSSSMIKKYKEWRSYKRGSFELRLAGQ